MNDDREAILPLIPFPPTKADPHPCGGLLIGHGVLSSLREPSPPPNVLPPQTVRIKAGKSPIYFLS